LIQKNSTGLEHTTDGCEVTREPLAPDVLASFLRQHYTVAANFPPEIVVPEDVRVRALRPVKRMLELSA